MELRTVEEGGVTAVEGAPGAAFMAGPGDAGRLIEACFSASTRAALLYAENLSPGFFDLSSREAGELLQKLRNYDVRLAVVVPAGGARESSRFGEMVAEERKGRHFALFETRDAARAWLAAA